MLLNAEDLFFSLHLNLTNNILVTPLTVSKHQFNVAPVFFKPNPIWLKIRIAIISDISELPVPV